MNKTQQRERLNNWIELLTVFPATTPEGRCRDELYRRKLQAQLTALNENALAVLYRQSNHLRRQITEKRTV